MLVGLVIFTGTLGNVASAAPKPMPPFPAISLPENAQGEKAIKALAGKLPEVAAWYEMTPQQFAKMIRTDNSVWLDEKGRVFFIDVFPEPAPGEGTSDVSEAPFPYSETFTLHSRPGSKRVIYLDFDGHTTTGTAWNNSYGEPIVSPAYSIDSDRTQFSNSELDRIQNIWRRVAEDYAPFDVDVTTQDPGQNAITRSNISDDVFGTRVVMTVDDFASCGCGGFAYLSAYNDVGDYYKPAFVFNNSEVGVAEAVSHEAGHNFNLKHDGDSNVGYYAGHGSGATGWAPIMGVGYYQQLVQWSKGEYADSNNQEDDIQLIQDYGAPLLADDHGNTEISATPLGTSTDGTTVTLSGIGLIENSTDIDAFQFISGTGDISIQVNPSPLSPNLDILAELLDNQGNVIASSNPADSLPAAIDVTGLAAGEYYIKIDGIGKGDPLLDGYTDYASLGNYTLNGTVPDPGLLQPPVAKATNLSGPGHAPLAVSFNSAGSTDTDGNIVGYEWDFGDGSGSSTASDPSYTYDTPGNYIATLTVTDNDGLTDNDTTNVAVLNWPPVAMVSGDPISGAASLTVNFSSSGSNDPDEPYGSITAYSWDFGDGTSSADPNPSHIYDTAGTYTAILTVTDDFGDTGTASTSITVDPPVSVDQYATSEIFVAGTVSGSFGNTSADDGIVESIQERESGGKKNNRYSYLEHIWTFNVQSGNSVTFYLNAWQSTSSDDETMEFAYSTDGGTSYDPLVTISNTTDSGTINIPLPSGTQGNVRIRVRDTDRTPGQRSLDTIYVDQMFIRTENQSGGLPPTAPADFGAMATSETQVDLTWIDTSDNEDGFRVERSIDSGATWNVIATVSTDISSYSDTSATPGTTFTYRVTAYNGSGQSYSNTAVATTPGNAPITLTANGYKVKGVQHVELTWSGATSVTVDIKRDGTVIMNTSTSNRPYVDAIGNKGGGSYVYEICEPITGPCSDPVTVVF